MPNPRISVTHDLLKLIAEIDEFKGRWQALGALTPDRLMALRRVATIESVGSSTRIEGAMMTDSEVATLLANLGGASLATRDEQEVTGYAEAMDHVFEAHADLSLTENHIRQLHQSLLCHSTKDERHRGSYKTVANPVAALDDDGRELGVVFATTSPLDTPREMAALVAWTARAIEAETLHPLLITAVFVVVFLAIHPFQDGNGRLSRVLTTLLLLRAGYDYVPYASLESVIEANKEQYYAALRRTQTTLADDDPDWGPWVGFSLRCLKTQKDDLTRRLESEQASADDDADLPALSLRILALMSRGQRQTIGELVAATGANRNTLKVRLRELVEAGRIVRRGKGRGTWYSGA
jgi:Fic family protein